jgi:hypothetical protein
MVMVDGEIIVKDGRLTDPRWNGLNARARRVGLDLLDQARLVSDRVTFAP